MDEYRLLSKYRKQSNSNNSYKKVFCSFLNKVLLSIIIFLTALIASKNDNYKKNIYKYVYDTNFSFLEFEELYNKYLGLLIPINNSLDTEVVNNDTIIYQDLKETENGVLLTVVEGSTVSALESGLVIFMGEKDSFEDVVVLEQVDGSEAWYVGVIDSNLKIYDYVEKSSIIGVCKTNSLSLFFKKNGEVLDYKKYLF